jgi:hypothetical protein
MFLRNGFHATGGETGASKSAANSLASAVSSRMRVEPHSIATRSRSAETCSCAMDSTPGRSEPTRC